jgi:hypothetical protein
MFVNDLLDLESCYLFADDCLVVSYGPDYITSANLLETDLVNYSDWYKANLLVLNASKTDILTLSSSKISMLSLPKIKFQGLMLKQSDKIKYLGCILDYQLKMNKHISYTKKKLYPIIKNFMTNRRFINKHIAASWYKCLIRPILEYCAPCIFTAGQSLINEVDLIENRCLKIISSDKNCNTRTIFNIPSIKFRLKYLYLLAFFKLTHNYVPIINDSILPVKVDSITRLGATGGFLLGVGSGARTTLSFGASLYNGLPQHVRGLSILKDFKINSKIHLLLQL